MTLELTTPYSRRALLAAAAGGVAAAFAASVGRIAPVDGANGDAIRAGQLNEASSETVLRSTGPGLAVETIASHDAILARSSNGIALGGSTDSTDGLALATTGRVKLREVSGIATIRKGRKSVTVKPVEGIHGRPMVLLTPLANLGSRGLWYSVQPSKDSLTIRISTSRKAATRVAWLILEWG